MPALRIPRKKQPILPELRPEPPVGRVWLRKLPFFALAPLGLLLTALSRIDASLTERLWSASVYPVLAQVIGFVTNLIPVSLAELLVILLIPGLVVFIAALVRQIRRSPGAKALIFSRFFAGLLAAASAVYFAFVLLAGINYNRLTFADYSGLEIRPSSASELAALCAELAESANALRPEVESGQNGVMTLTGDYYSAANCAKSAMETLSAEYPVLAGRYARPKPVMLSRLMSYTHISGIFFPFTAEANVNVDIPDWSIPSTMCHELSHLRGFMREDEANFIAYLACRTSDRADFRYSGTMLALVYSMNELYSADYDLFGEVWGTYSDGVKLDFAYQSAYWKQFEGPVSEVSSKVNDAYLKANKQVDGVKSYGRMVDLLLADYRERTDIE